MLRRGLLAVGAIAVVVAIGVGIVVLLDDQEPKPTVQDGLIAFMRPGTVGEYDIWTVGPDGGEPLRLTESPASQSDYNPTWSPDGSTVLFERRGEANEDLHVVPASGGEVTRLAACTDLCWGDGEARYSPDGSSIAFMRASDDAIAIYVRSEDGADTRQLSHPSAEFEDHYPSWSPDGTTILFQRDTRSSVPGQTRLMAVDLESGAERLVYAIPVSAPGSGIASYSPDGRRILFGYWCIWGDQCPEASRAMRNSRLATIRPDGTGLKVLPIALRADSASWSPTGKFIVFRCTAANFARWSLCTSRADGSQVKRRSFAEDLGSVHPSWGIHP
jgi:Tol biopolymer transport system component